MIAVLIAWVSVGAVRRGRNWLAWALVISVTGLVGVVVWLVVRRRSIVVAERLGSRHHDNWGPNVIPEGYYFVMGDRRNNSSDSRHWGFVPKKYIVGRVQYRWWPVSTARTF